jgi:hypothetical protein
VFRFNYLDATHEQGPHPFVLSFNNSGRGPNSTSLPFQKSGYRHYQQTQFLCARAEQSHDPVCQPVLRQL